MTSLRPGKSFRSLYDDLVDPLLRGCVFFCFKRRTLLTVRRYEYLKISEESNRLWQVRDDGVAAAPRVSEGCLSICQWPIYFRLCLK